MPPTASSPISENTIGATIFLLYIVAALGLTGLISYDLVKAYNAFASSRTSTRAPFQINSVLIFSALAALSFSVLSYHMLNVLIYSYVAWARDSQVSLPRSLFDVNLSQLYIWTWAKSSTLFRDFAETICDDSLRFWWTQQALSFSMMCNIFMAVEGTKRDIPRLWAYFLLAQILPQSLTQNLFCIAILLTPPVKTERKLYAAHTIIQILLPLTYLYSLSSAPDVVGTTLFFPVLFTTRALLFAPFFVMKPCTQLSWRTSVGRSSSKRTLLAAYGPAWKMMLVCAILLQIRQSHLAIDNGENGAVIKEGLKTINEYPAVSALAYDYILGVFSSILFWSIS